MTDSVVTHMSHRDRELFRELFEQLRKIRRGLEEANGQLQEIVREIRIK